MISTSTLRNPVTVAHPSIAVQFSDPVTCYNDSSEIYAPGEKASRLHVVAFGAVRVYRLLADGRRQISAFHLSGEVFGFEADGTHNFFADAIGATGVRSLRGSGLTAENILPLALDRLARAQEHQLLLGRQCATEKLAAFLLDMATRQGDLEQFDLPMTRSDIGDYLGLTIETVSRTLSKFKTTGVIRLVGLRCVEIRNNRMLRSMAA